jgi:hypothetical protein
MLDICFIKYPMIRKAYMGVTQNKESTTSEVTQERQRKLKSLMDVMEMKMRIARMKDEEDMMMFMLSELGDDGLSWFVGLDEKPTTVQEMKEAIIRKWDAELAWKQLSEKEKAEKMRIQERIEQEVAKRVQCEMEKMVFARRERMKNPSYATRRRNIVLDVICYKCGKNGHIARGCRMNFKEKSDNKKDFEYSSIKYNNSSINELN